MDVEREDGGNTSSYLPPVHKYKNVDRNKTDKEGDEGVNNFESLIPYD